MQHYAGVGGDNDGDNPRLPSWTQKLVAGTTSSCRFHQKDHRLATMWVGSTGSATRYPNPPFHACSGRGRRRWILSPYSLPHWDVDMPALRQLHILHCALEIIPPIDSPALENTDRRLSASQDSRHGRIQSTSGFTFGLRFAGFRYSLDACGGLQNDWAVNPERDVTRRWMRPPALTHMVEASEA
jgi:hypothetical protein